MLIAWTVALLLILVNSLYVAAEFATVAARSAKLRKLAEQGHTVAAKLLRITEQPIKLDEYIASCQIGITLSSLVLGAYTEINMGPTWTASFMQLGLDHAYAESIAAFVILAIFTVLQILLGELLPKSISLQFSERVALLMYWPLKISSTLFTPFIWVLNGSGLFLLKLIGIPASSHKHIHSLEEIELLLAESRDGGLLEAKEHARLHQALEMSDKTARQLMTPRTKIVSVNKEISVAECYQLALESPYTRLLVYGKDVDDLVGIINVKDVIHALLNEPDKTIEEIIRPVPVVPENLTLARLITLLKTSHSHVAIVVDEHGSTRGMVTAGDILAEVMEDTEKDEFKQSATFEILSDGQIRVPGAYKLHRCERFIGKMPESDAVTINGLIAENLQRVPVPGDELELEQVTLVVEQVLHNAASSVLIKKRGKHV